MSGYGGAPSSVIFGLVGIVGLGALGSARAQEEPGEVAIPDFTVAVAPDEGTEKAGGDIDLGTIVQSAVYSVSKRPQLVRESPGVASVITQDQAHRYGWWSLNDVLYRQPGFAPSRDFERRVVAARGQFESWNNNHLLLLVDGVPFNDNLYGTAYTWEITPLELASAVEVVRGPASALYGGNATNGLVNMRTPTIDPGKHELAARVNVGVDGTQRYHAFGGQGTKAGSVIVSYDLFDTPGDEYKSLDASGSGDTREVQDERADQYFFGKLSGNDIAPGLSLQVHHQRWNFETGHGWLFNIPDDAHPDRMHESRTLAALSYHRSSEKVEQEYVVRYQRHDIDWHNMYLPSGANCGDPADMTYCYPDGLLENLQTHTQDVFGRAQAAVDLPKQMNVLGGVDYSMFRYGGDSLHESNIDLTSADADGDGIGDGTFTVFPDGMMHTTAPFLERIQDHPVNNIGAFAQLATGQLFGRRATATLGARFDRMFFNYNQLTVKPYPTPSKDFQQLSPRAAVVVFPTDKLSVKLLAGRGFRAPAPSELFGANTYALASNIDQLKPETVTTFELAFDWAVVGNWIWRANTFYRKFNDQIAYSVANANLSTNVYSNTTAGAETEVLTDLAVGSTGRIQGFFNYSLAQLLDETISDETIIKSDKLTWAPEHVANLGLSFRGGKLDASAQVHVQGPVRRRESDVPTPDTLMARGVRVDGWATIDARAAYQLVKWAELGVQATNLLDSDAPIIKNNNLPFDYRGDGRRVLVTLDLRD
jgi:outer membrane receptor protein involved in Fe transport